MEQIVLQPEIKYSIGRSQNCHIIIRDNHISNEHCFVWSTIQELGKEQDVRSLYIEDCSSNGTWVQQHSVSEPCSSTSTGAVRLVKGIKTQLAVNDCIHLKSPQVFPNNSIGFVFKMDKSKNFKLEPLQHSYGKSQNVSDVVTFLHLHETVVDGLLPNKKPKLVTFDSEENPLLGSQEEYCPTCMSVFALPELIDHAELCCLQNKGKTKISADPIKEASTSFDESNENQIEEDLELCGYCLKEFPVVKLIQHAASCSSRHDLDKIVMEQCHHCWMLFSLSDLFNHVAVCPAKLETSSQDAPVQSSQDVHGEAIERCMHCFRDFPVSRLVIHSAKCKGDLLGEQKNRFKDFLPSVHDFDAMAMLVLSPTQQAAVDFVVRRSQMASTAVMPELLSRVKSLGYNDDDIKKTFYWIKYEAPIIIHINLDTVLKYLVEDTHYRNLFETGTGFGSTDFSCRKSWEDRIFNGIYHSSSPHERVKYGVLNIVGDINGVKSCYPYGDSFLQLKKVRLRTTFASMDTAFEGVKLACCEHYANVLAEYNNTELQAIINVATRRVPWAESTVISNYKEVQIHGPICLSENIDCIVVNDRFKRNGHITKLLEIFVKKNNCNLIWMDVVDSGSL